MKQTDCICFLFASGGIRVVTSWHRSRPGSVDFDMEPLDELEFPPDVSHGFAAVASDDPARISIPGNEPNAWSQRDADHFEDWTWRCLACDSQECGWSNGSWVCSACGRHEFYRSNQPAKKMTQDGTWMFIPHGHTERVSPLSKSARRRKRRVNAGDPSGSSVDGGEFDPEEESHTTDQVVEPSVRAPSVHSQPRRLQPTLQPQSQNAMSSNADQDRLLDALRRLVTSKKQDDDDWSSQAGPQKGVRWRGGAVPQPPQWRYDRDDLRAYSKFVKKVDIWKLQAAPFMSKKEMSLALYNSLQGEAGAGNWSICQLKRSTAMME